MRRANRWFGILLTAAVLLTAAPKEIPAQELTAAETQDSAESVQAPSEEGAQALTETEAPRMDGGGYRQLRLIEAGQLEEAPVSRAQYGASASEYWKAFGSDYFYEQMNSQEQAFYDGLYVAAMNMLTGSQNADVITIDGERYHHIPYVSGGTLSSDEACWIATVFQLSNPQFYFISDAMCWGYNSQGIQFGLCLYEDFADGAVRSRYTQQLRSTVDGLLQQVNAQPDPVSMEKKAHDLIIEMTSYHYGTYNQSCAGVFFENAAVCAGYAEAFAMLCNGVGLETISVTSTTHEWNEVKLYGRWYAVDCTWDDPGNGISYEYFNVTDAYMDASDNDHELESLWGRYDVPACVNSTVIQKGLYIYNGIDYSDVFDEYYYVRRYADMKAAFGSDWQAALQHFVEHGMQEGRQACESFDVLAYKARYKDLRMTFGNDLKSYYLHYINNGRREGRLATGSHTITSGVTVYKGVDYASVYDYSYYVSRYPDIARAYPNDDLSVLAYFVEQGMAAGQQASAAFDVNSYYNAYPDLRRIYGRDWRSYYLHYMNYGRREGRITAGVTELRGAVTVYNGVDYSAVYDFAYYTSRNPDVARTFGNDEAAVLAHFVNHGMSEGRIAKESFNVRSYMRRYKDLRQSFGYDMEAYFRHYMTNGLAEHRIGYGTVGQLDGVTVYNGVDYSAVYNYQYYVERYPDIARTFGEDDIAVLQHFVNHGMSEGRQGCAGFNPRTYRQKYPDLDAAFGDNNQSYFLHYLNHGIREGRTA